jgi:hypothetical protein
MKESKKCLSITGVPKNCEQCELKPGSSFKGCDRCYSIQNGPCEKTKEFIPSCQNSCEISIL